MTELKQPREDVTGTSRDTDDLLSLDERAMAHRDALIAMAKHLHAACLVGHPAPIVQRMYERISKPRVGDLVVESSSGMHSSDADKRFKAFGVLVEKREEWWEADEEWEGLKAEDHSLADEDRLTDTAWYVQYGPQPEDVCRWTDCSFIAIPTELREFDATPRAYSLGSAGE